jgi:hypothetical protein
LTENGHIVDGSLTSRRAWLDRRAIGEMSDAGRFAPLGHRCRPAALACLLPAASFRALTGQIRSHCKRQRSNPDHGLGKVLDCFGSFSCSHDDIGARDAMRLNFSISSLSSENKWQVTGQCPVNRPMSPRAAKKALCE